MKARPSGLLLIILGIVAVAALTGPDRSAPRATLPAGLVATPSYASPQTASLEEPPSSAAAVDPRSAITRRSASVSVSSARVRVGPTLKARQIGSLPRGAAVDVVGEQGEWLSIEAPARQLASWTHSSYPLDGRRIGLHALAWNRPFIGETGYRSFLNIHASPARSLTPDAFAAEVIAAFVTRECGGGLIAIERRYRPLAGTGRHGRPYAAGI
jgi:hypothetical protein